MKRFLLGLLALAVVAGIAIFLVAPMAGNQYRLWRDADAVSAYRRAAAALDAPTRGALLAQARGANDALAEADLRDAYGIQDAPENAAAEPLDVAGSGVIAVLEIPKLGVTLPVTRRLDASALARGAAHLAGTSLPVGGEGAHCVLAGQGGGRLSDPMEGLIRLIPGDCFYVRSLRDTLAYEVFEVETLGPSDLTPEPLDGAADLCTLMTAPSDGERLLVRARRVGRRQTPLEDDTQALPGWAARLIFAAPLALAGLIVLALIEGVRRAAARRRLRRMKL